MTRSANPAERPDCAVAGEDRSRRRRFTCRGCGPSSLLTTPASTYSMLYAGGELMKTMTYSESRAHYAETLNAVVDDREEVVITRTGHDPVVIVALDDYQSLKETAYLLRSPENARRLLASIDRLEHSGGAAHDLLDDTADERTA